MTKRKSHAIHQRMYIWKCLTKFTYEWSMNPKMAKKNYQIFNLKKYATSIVPKTQFQNHNRAFSPNLVASQFEIHLCSRFFSYKRVIQWEYSFNWLDNQIRYTMSSLITYFIFLCSKIVLPLFAHPYLEEDNSQQSSSIPNLLPTCIKADECV